MSRITPSGQWWRRGSTVTAAGVGVLLLASSAPAVSAARASDVGASGGAASTVAPLPTVALVGVIVQAAPGALAPARDAVARLGGTPGRSLPIISGFAARIRPDRLAALRALPGVRAVTTDARIRATGAPTPVDTGPSGAWDARHDAGSLQNVAHQTGASALWARTDARGARVTGRGVGVALVDSGVAPVAGLTAPGAVVNGPDLSFDSEDEGGAARHRDSFGHGTHLAGIIAGRDATAARGRGPAPFTGMAPGAHLVSVRVAAGDGATDVSQVIAAIDWVVTHRDDDGLNIRVLNLSYGTDSTQDPRLDPLAFAAEAAWRKGIVVVASAGNAGAGADRLTDPAVNPYVIAAGASDSRLTVRGEDDTVAAFSSRGSAARGADLLAPGRSIVSLRNPGSFVDEANPQGRVGERYLRGSGTSQAAAVVSGAAALLLQQRPSLTPDQVKELLTSTADRVRGADARSAGAGRLDVLAASKARPSAQPQSFPASVGTGSLEGARGTDHVVDTVTGAELQGEVDVMGGPWDGATWAAAAAAGLAWTGGSWNGTAWTGDGWTGQSWAGRSWGGRSWGGRSWGGRSWGGRSWGGRSWGGRSWGSSAWLSERWG